MICCDLCDEWYHGDCVGIKPRDGKRMEKEKIEFVCNSCHSMSDYKKMNDLNVPLSEVGLKFYLFFIYLFDHIICT